MEATRHRRPIFTIRTLTLSIAALLFLVNARAQTLTSLNTSKNSSKNSQELSRLVELLLTKGANSEVNKNLAPVIGLEKQAPTKIQVNIVSKKDQKHDERACFVVLGEADDGSARQPMCLFVRRSQRGSGDVNSTYFKVNLFGKLEKVVATSGKYDEKTGHGIAGSGVRTEHDIQSAAVKKEFNAEMSYWLKDWLKKELKAPSKKDAASVTPTVGKTATAAL